MSEINGEVLTKLKEDVEAKKAAVDFTKIDTNLGYYKDFVLNIRTRLGEVKDIEDFKEFRKDWQHSIGVLSLPSQLKTFHDYIAVAEQYNTALFAISESGKISGFMPELYNETVCSILLDSAEVFKHPFNKEYLRGCLVGDDTRKAIYTHLVAVAEPIDIKAMVDAGEIRKETILSLPKAITVRDLTLGEKTDSSIEYYMQDYYKHLKQLYRDFELILPDPIIHKAEKLKGVTFDGRDDKLRYIMGQLGTCDESNMMDYRSRLQLSAERYTFKGINFEEPAVRILATIPGDKTCRKVDIGNLDREFALRLGEYYADADLAVDVEALGIFETGDGKREPFMRMQVSVAEKESPLEKEKDAPITDLSELEDAFSMEDLN